MSRRRPPEEPEAIPEANVLPVMNIMFLLIPALLLAMEVASMASIAVSPPQHRSDASTPTPKDPDERLDLTVMISTEGFTVAPGKAAGSAQPNLPLAKPDAPLADFDRYDYAALEQTARDYKAKYPDELTVRVSAEGDIPIQVLIQTLDALRGSDCRLVAGGDAPGSCLFTLPTVDAGL
jgi:biopolymer transport protein ExbD